MSSCNIEIYNGVEYIGCFFGLVWRGWGKAIAEAFPKTNEKL